MKIGVNVRIVQSKRLPVKVYRRISGILGTTTLDSNQTSLKAVCPACRVPTLHVCAAVESVKNNQNVLTGTVCNDPLFREEMYKVNHGK